MRLIDPNELEKVLRPILTDESCPLHIAAEIDMNLDLMPKVDAVPVVHGRWETDGMIMDDGEYLMTRCTACGEVYEYGYNMPFCPNCGANMRKDGSDNG